MATGFKSATVNAASVPSTQTNFPAYVDLSRTGITTLAEAQSVRVYADSGKTTEWAREIVSATQMHVKIPSLTSTVTMYVDWDGVRADYAVTDTYGRNAVWSGFQAAHHFETNSNDSTVNALNGTDTSITYSAGKIGNAASTTGGKIALPSFTLNASFSVLLWVQVNAAVDPRYGFTTYNGTGDGSGTATYWACRENSFPVDSNYSNEAVETTATAKTRGSGEWWRVAITHNGTLPIIYENATNRSVTGDTPHASTARVFNYLSRGDSATQRLNGAIDEAYIINSQVSADWVTVDSNNQGAESTFWGTWTTVGGGFTPTPLMHMMQITGGIV